MEPNMSSVFVALVLLELFSMATIINNSFCSGSGTTYVGCLESEREALLKLKKDLNDSSNGRLASWNGDGDCCKWGGVVCNNFSGHVLQLNLGNPFNYLGSDAESDAYEKSKLVGKLNPSLLDLKHLTHLDLSGNDFQGSRIPKYVGSLENLRYLNLSGARFTGKIPHKLGNLSNLQYLDLSDSVLLESDSFSWLVGLPLLQYLDLSWAKVSKDSDLLVITNSLPYLKTLKLVFCELSLLPPLSTANFSSLTTLDISFNALTYPLILSWDSGLSHLVFLDLSHNLIQGPIPDGLGNLTSLRHLDLSFNKFNSKIPVWFSRINGLQYLSLKINKLQGNIPRSLGNLTSIQTLDLSGNALGGKIPSSFGNLCRLRSISLSTVRLSQEISEVLDIFSGCVAYELESLNFSYGQFSGHLTNQLGQFRNLVSLDISSNCLSGPIPWSIGELSSLTSLDLSFNRLSGSVPSSLGKLLSLRILSLSFNRMDGPIPSSLGNLSSLTNLELSYNKLTGPILSSLGNLSSLTNLELSYNKLTGPIPSSLGNLLSLTKLRLSDNKLNGIVSEVHFVNLTKLTWLSASGNSLILQINPNWVPPFQLEFLNLSLCHVGPQFPLWLHSQKRLRFLDVSNAGILDTVPRWFWESIGQYFILILSHNQIYGGIPNLISTPGLGFLDLSSNKFSGPLPYLSSLEMEVFDLSNNALSGTVSPFLCNSGGNLTNDILFLKLGENLLSGDIPDCWMKFPNLIGLNLSHNKFTGSLPISMGTLNSLQSLNLHNNKLSGVIPESFKNCTDLVAFDIGENEFFGNIPTWMGERFSALTILNLRSNKFHGILPIQFCRLTSLQILDVAYNRLTGTIPNCINNFTAMVTTDSNHSTNDIFYASIEDIDIIEEASLVMKGTTFVYNSILNLVRSIDISKNNFSGAIPVEVTSLNGLQSLNLSHNFFTGKIPENIGNMKSIESLDFSTNQLYGKIPPSMSSLSFLNHLNLSDNNLTGKIPSSTQLQSFGETCFVGNDLCGAPLPNCIEKNVYMPEVHNGNEKEDEDEVDWLLYVSMALGFVMGFWCFIGPLLINRRWRYKFCHFLDGLGDKFTYFVRKCY